MIDYDAVVFDPVYDTFGELAVLSIGSSSYDIVVIDNTKGVSVEDGSIAGMHTIHPAVDVRRSSLSARSLPTSWSVARPYSPPPRGVSSP